MFLWSKVLCDWTCGMVVVFAPDLKQALDLVEKEDGHYAREGIEGRKPDEMIWVSDCGSPRAYVAHGGG